jgi:hypothetical protein
MGWTYNTPDGIANDGQLISGVAIFFTAASLIILCLRFYVRGWMIKAVGADDLILIITWVSKHNELRRLRLTTATDSSMRFCCRFHRSYVSAECYTTQ